AEDGIRDYKVTGVQTCALPICAFQKVGECLYRYSSNGVYYARFESGGKEIRRSLRTTDRASAQRALAWFKEERKQVDPAQGKLRSEERRVGKERRSGRRRYHRR